MEAVGATPVEQRSNRVHWFAGRIHEVLDDLLGLAPAPRGGRGQESSAPAPTVCVSELSAAQTAEAITELAVAHARLQGLALALLAHAEVIDVAAASGATSTAAWWAHATVATRREANRLARLAGRLDGGDHEPTRTALLTGAVDAERAAVVLDAVEALPGSVGRAERQHAEQHLLEEATRHHATDLTRLGPHLHHVIDPDAADHEDAQRLAAEERDAARRTMLKLHDDGSGTCHGTFRIPSADGAKLATALDAFASPRRPDPIPREARAADGRVRPVSTPELLGQALCQWIDRLPAHRLPTAGGSNATVVVTMTLDTLLGGLRPATLDTGGRLSGPQARVLACQAGVIPAVLGTDSHVLDLGRRARFHTTAQRIAITHRDRHCTATGCSVPAAWCHVHHKTPWSRGGSTTVHDGTLLCARHHTMVHHPDYAVTYRSDGRTEINRTRRRRS